MGVVTSKRIAAIDRELVIGEQLKQTSGHYTHLAAIFSIADISGDGNLTREEMEAFLNDACTLAYMATLDISAGDARGVFHLLVSEKSDRDGVQLEEFIGALMRFAGPARAIDMATLLYEQRKFYSRWNA